MEHWHVRHVGHGVDMGVCWHGQHGTLLRAGAGTNLDYMVAKCEMTAEVNIPHIYSVGKFHTYIPPSGLAYILHTHNSLRNYYLARNQISLYIFTEYFKCAFAVAEILRELKKKAGKAFMVLK